MLRAEAKHEAVGQGVYAKGSGETNRDVRRKFYPGELWVPLERAEKGSRQDLSTKAAWATFANLRLIVLLLRTVLYAGPNILKDYLFIMLTFPPVVAAIRARAIIDDKWTAPSRYLCSSSDLAEWSILNMAPLMDITKAELEKLKADGRYWMSREHDPYAVVEQHHAGYRRYKEARAATKRPSVVPTFPEHDEMYEVRTRLYAADPELDELTKTALEVWAGGMLNTLLNGNAMRYVADGDLGVNNQTAAMKKDLSGTWTSTCVLCESYYGLLKLVASHFDNISVEAADAIAMAIRNKLFPIDAPRYYPTRLSRRILGTTGARRRAARLRRRIARVGALEHHGDKMTEAMVVAASRGKAKRAALEAKRAAKAKVAQVKLDRRQADTKLAKQVTQYVKGVAAYEALRDSALKVGDKAKLRMQLSQFDAPRKKGAFLKGQISFFVDGCGFVDLRVQWASSVIPEIGKEGTEENATHLHSCLLRIWATIQLEKRELPSEAPVPTLAKRKLLALGVPTQLRVELEAEELRSDAEVKAAAAALPAKSASRGGCSVARAKKDAAPQVDAALVGRRVEYVWEITYTPEEGDDDITDNFRCPGTVLRVAEEGASVEIEIEGGKKGKGKRKLKIGPGWVFIKYDDKMEQWAHLRPSFYRKSTPGGWFLLAADGDDSGLEEASFEGQSANEESDSDNGAWSDSESG